MSDLDNVSVEKTKKQQYDERRAKEKKEKEKALAKEEKKRMKAELKKQYKNPAYSTFGKILIWILMISMVAAFVVSLIYLIIQNV